jgi:membrane protease YdiL (CAAX protease family)
MKHKAGLVIISLYFLAVLALNIYVLVSQSSNASESERYQFAAKSIYSLAAISFVCIALLVWLEAKHLANFHLDRTSLLLLVIFGPFVRTTPRLLGQQPYLIVIWVACLLILINIIRYWSIIPKTNFKLSSPLALTVEFGFFAILVIEFFQPDLYTRGDPSTFNPGLKIIRDIIYNLAAVSTVEEILFRGFLWGYLTQIGLSEKKAFWTQGVFFWLGHLSRSFWAPITFFITIPITTYIFSQIVRKTNQVFWSIVVHTFFNVIGPLILTMYFLRLF